MNQLICRGTSVGANFREAFYSYGKSDFIAKLQIALNECSESEYWLDFLLKVVTIMIKRLLKCVLRLRNY